MRYTSSGSFRKMRPDSIRPGGFGIRRRIERAVTDLPHPVSPTRPTVSPFWTSRSIPSTAFTVPSYVWKYVWRASMRRIVGASAGSPPQVRVEDVPEPVAEEVEAQDREDDRDPGEDGHPGGLEQ